MSRSLKKGPYINVSLEKKILAMNESGKKTVVKTWARASMISPDFVGHTVAVHNGNKFIPVYITENMVGHKLGEFSPTRRFIIISYEDCDAAMGYILIDKALYVAQCALKCSMPANSIAQLLQACSVFPHTL